MSYVREQAQAALLCVGGCVIGFLGIFLMLLWYLKWVDYIATHSTNILTTRMLGIVPHFVAALTQHLGIIFQIVWSLIPLSTHNPNELLTHFTISDFAYWFLAFVIVFLGGQLFAQGGDLSDSITDVKKLQRQRLLLQKRGMPLSAPPVNTLTAPAPPSPIDWRVVIFWPLIIAIVGPLIVQFLTINLNLPH